MGRQADVAPLDTILSVWGNAVRDTGVIWFASAAERTSQWPSPHEGALSYLQDSNDYWSYNGSSWVAFGGGAPTGAAGGDLSGTYPNPSVVDDSHAHTSSTLPATIVYDGDTAGGDLSGTYPNPSVTDDSHTHTSSTLPATIVYDGDTAGGDLSGTYPNPSVTDDSHNHTGSTISALDTGDITTGTMATARLGSGTADGTTFLRGDSTWATPAGGGSGHVIQEEGTPLTARAALNFTGTSITATDDAGNNRTNVAMDADVDALAALAGTGIAVRTGANTWAQRTLSSATAALTITDPAGVAADPSFDLDGDLKAIAALTRTEGDLIVGGASAWQDLAIGAAGDVLTSDGTTAAWVAPTEIGDLPEGTRADGTELVPVEQSSAAVSLTLDEFVAGPVDVASGARGVRYRVWEDFDGLVALNTTDDTYYGSQKTLIDLAGAAAQGSAQRHVNEILSGHSVYGVGRIETGTAATGRINLKPLSVYYTFVSTDEIRFICRIRTEAVTDSTFTIRAGFMDNADGTTPANGGFWVQAASGANWRCINMDDSVTTDGDSGIAVSTAAYVNIGIHWDGSTCRYWMSTGTSAMTNVVTQATNKPDDGTQIAPSIVIVKSSTATNRLLDIDGWGYDLPLSRGLSFRV